MSRWVIAFLLALTTGWALPAVASAVLVHPPRLYFSDRAVGSAMSDGERWVAYQRTGTSVRVIDTVQRRAFDLNDPPGCGLVDIGESELLFRCEPAHPPAILVNLFTRVAHAPVGATAGDSFYTVGRYWLHGFRELHPTVPYGAQAMELYLNWRTGATGFAPESANATTTLDSPQLDTDLCSPLGRIPNDPPAGHETIPPFRDYAYRPPYAATTAGFDPVYVVLDGCGTRPVRRFACVNFCEDVQLGTTALTWTNNDRGAHNAGRAGAYLIRYRRFVGFSLYGSEDRLAHTRNRIYASSPVRRDNTWIIRSAYWRT